MNLIRQAPAGRGEVEGESIRRDGSYRVGTTSPIIFERDRADLSEVSLNVCWSSPDRTRQLVNESCGDCRVCEALSYRT